MQVLRKPDKPPPNGVRLSCGAELEGSQPELYNTECRGVTEPIGDGRRQLQALVRQPASHRAEP